MLRTTTGVIVWPLMVVAGALELCTPTTGVPTMPTLPVTAAFTLPLTGTVPFTLTGTGFEGGFTTVPLVCAMPGRQLTPTPNSNNPVRRTTNGPASQR